jgi:hypothetical protein
MTDDAHEEAQYLANPLAFWLRPDRHEHGVECWMIDEPYVPKPPAPPTRPPERDEFGMVHLLPGEKVVFRDGDMHFSALAAFQHGANATRGTK